MSMMIIPLLHYNVSEPPPPPPPAHQLFSGLARLSRLAAAVARHFALPKQTPWRRPCMYIYIHWASKKTNHFFRATHQNYHIRTQISNSSLREAHLKYQRVTFVKKEKNAVKSQNVILQKNHKNHRNCSLKTSTKGCLFRTFNQF